MSYLNLQFEHLDPDKELTICIDGNTVGYLKKVHEPDGIKALFVAKLNRVGNGLFSKKNEGAFSHTKQVACPKKMQEIRAIFKELTVPVIWRYDCSSMDGSNIIKGFHPTDDSYEFVDTSSGSAVDRIRDPLNPEEGRGLPWAPGYILIFLGIGLATVITIAVG